VTSRRPSAPVPYVLDFLARAYPEARILLDYRNPFELLVATVLAAQCTDERVNRVTPSLFLKYPGPRALAEAKQESAEEIVRPTGFFRNKAKAIRELSAAIVERHGGKVPATMDALTALPGVGRKTASILLGDVSGSARCRWTRTSAGCRSAWASPLRRIPTASSRTSPPSCPQRSGGNSPRAWAGTDGRSAWPETQVPPLRPVAGLPRNGVK
jgi:hypothetical protein